MVIPNVGITLMAGATVQLPVVALAERIINTAEKNVSKYFIIIIGFLDTNEL